MPLPAFLVDLGVTPSIIWGAGALLVIILLTILVSNIDMTEDDLNAVRAEAGHRMAAAAQGQTRAMTSQTGLDTQKGGTKEE